VKEKTFKKVTKARMSTKTALSKRFYKIRCVHCNKEFPGSTDNLCPNCFNAGVSFALIFINQEKESKVIHEA
jgi:rRNA maturation endonuclease Nob1